MLNRLLFGRFLLMLSPSFWNPSALTLFKSRLPVPVGLLNWFLRLRLIGIRLPWLNLDFRWRDQLDAANLTRRRCHVGSVQPVVVVVLDPPILLRALALFELGD